MSANSSQSGFAAPVVVAVALLAALVGLWLGSDWYGHRQAGPIPAAPQLQAGTALPWPKPLTPLL